MQASLNYYDFVSQIVPQNMSGTVNYRINILKHHTRSDGTNALYLNIYHNGDRKRLSLNIAVPLKYFDIKKQRVKPSYKFAPDYNMLIEKMLADLNAIEVAYRLNNEKITIDKIIEDLYNPSLRINFNAFANKKLEHDLSNGFIKQSTYRQQKAFLGKLKKWKDPLLFADIDDDFLKAFKSYLKNRLKNKASTIEGNIKNFKKYLHSANDFGIKTALNYKDVKVKKMIGEFTFLLPSELKTLVNFYDSPFINPTWKSILKRYLFSCFTGLRIGDIERLTADNFINGVLVITQQKTNKFNRIPLNANAKRLIDLPEVFKNSYSREHINRELKLIAKACNIKKRMYYHSSRHTFGTNYLIAGGKVENLQRLMGHSKIETTMIYVHAVESVTSKEINLMDKLME